MSTSSCLAATSACTHSSPTGAPVTNAPANVAPEMKLFTYKEVAKLLGVCQKTVENICRVRNEIPIVRIGNQPRIRHTDLQAYINAGGSPQHQV